MITKGKWEYHPKYKQDGKDLDTSGFITNDINGCIPVADMAAPAAMSLMEWTANANLIAAAPDMYEATKIALDLVQTVLYEHPLDDIALAQKEVIQAALSKAEGKE